MNKYNNWTIKQLQQELKKWVKMLAINKIAICRECQTRNVNTYNNVFLCCKCDLQRINKMSRQELILSINSYETAYNDGILYTAAKARQGR